MKICLLLLSLVLLGSPLTAQIAAAPATASDLRSDIAFDLFWRARVLRSHAGARVCSLPNKFYDDPKSPFRPLDERLKAAQQQFEKQYPDELDRTRAPYMMPPPQHLCDDPKAVWEAIFAFDTAVTALEAILRQP
jgi:hypothetical protein